MKFLTNCSVIKKYFLLLALLLSSTTAWTKVVNDEQMWFNLNSYIKLNDDWQLYTEFQPRYMDNRKYLSAYFLRLAIERKIGAGFLGGVGYAFSEFDNFPNPRYIHEDRFWLQLSRADEFGKWRISNRTRFEHRNFRHDDDVSYRLRHQVRLVYSLNETWKLITWDEWFWNSNTMTPEARAHQGKIKAGFDQNRTFVGAGYAFGEKKQHLFETGFLYQFINGIAFDRGNNIINTQVTFRF